MAKIQIYSVAERLPPIDEPLFLYDIGDSGFINQVNEVEAVIAIPEDSEEYSPDVYPEMVWVGMMQNGATPMLRADKWSYAVIEYGG
jgi:hypothetical protein